METSPDKPSSGRVCVFCGQSAGSREHALPQWLAAAMENGARPSTPHFFSDTDGWESQGAARKTNDLVTKRVCKKCNTGWMKKLEDAVIPFLSDLVKPGQTNFGRETLHLLRRHEPILRRWMTKTAITLSHLVSRSGVEQVPSHLAQETMEDRLADTALIYAGWVSKSDFAATINPGFPAFINGKFSRNLVRKDGRDLFHFGIQLNHLAVRIINVPGGGMVLLDRPEAGEPFSPSFVTERAHGAELQESAVFPDFPSFMKACCATLGEFPPTRDALREAGSSLWSPSVVP